MAVYKLRPVRVRALPVNTIIAQNGVQPPTNPTWVQNAIDQGWIIFQPNSQIAVTTRTGKQVGTVADVVIQDMIGGLSLMPITEFNALYQVD